jgi:hypothetical protein
MYGPEYPGEVEPDDDDEVPDEEFERVIAGVS